jgi:hypothetical protein
MLARAGRSLDLVEFLNAWACRLDAKKAPPLLRDWIRAHVSELELLELLSVTDDDAADHVPDILSLYESLMGLRQDLHNMSDAAASKVLHQLAPRLFVMWDKTIKGLAANQGYGDYGAFMTAMHSLSRRLLRDTELDAEGLELHLQQRLRYPVRKTLAKYIDEANWYWAVGRHSLPHGA